MNSPWRSVVHSESNPHTGTLNTLAFLPCFGLFLRKVTCKHLLVDRGFCPARSRSHSVPKKHTEAYILFINWLAYWFSLLINSHIFHLNPQFLSVLATWLGTFYQQGILILFPFGLGDNWRLTLSSSWNSPVLLAPPLLPAWLLASQGFTETVQDHCTRASSSIFLMESWFHVNLSTKRVFTFRVHTRRVESFGAGIPALVISSRVVPIVQGIDAFQTVCSCLTVHFPLGVYVHWGTRTCTFLWVCVWRSEASRGYLQSLSFVSFWDRMAHWTCTSLAPVAGLAVHQVTGVACPREEVLRSLISPPTAFHTSI